MGLYYTFGGASMDDQATAAASAARLGVTPIRERWPAWRRVLVRWLGRRVESNDGGLRVVTYHWRGWVLLAELRPDVERLRAATLHFCLRRTPP